MKKIFKWRRCKTCNLPLWISYFAMGYPFQKRGSSFKKASDCVDLLPKRVIEQIKIDVFKEIDEETVKNKGD